MCPVLRTPFETCAAAPPKFLHQRKLDVMGIISPFPSLKSIRFLTCSCRKARTPITGPARSICAQQFLGLRWLAAEGKVAPSFLASLILFTLSRVATHMVVWAVSDRTSPRVLAFGMMRLLGGQIHLRSINSTGSSSLHQSHWILRLGVNSLYLG